ncbi:MAG TPA: sigma-70 family RNA polymerase sigma factor [Gemmataceae bacterium]|nr:sigma-70 family RNA polymerase sigma factor [Gemmataceae bacterium]
MKSPPLNPLHIFMQQLRSALLLQHGADLTDGELLERFVSRREPAALEVLVRRHGAMVWGVCRRVLGNRHDAEDAFQATFLVLVRKAAAIHQRAKVGNWLYGVALKIALKARTNRAKRQAREMLLTNLPDTATIDQSIWSELQPILDQEVSRLPDKYRTVLILCALEGKTGKEAARHLGLPQGTVASRLARARGLLVKRLARHGIALSGGTLAAMLSQKAASACVPAAILSGTIEAAAAATVGRAAGRVSAGVIALAEGMLKAMALTQLKTAVTALLIVGAIICGGGMLIRHTTAGEQGTGEKRVYSSRLGIFPVAQSQPDSIQSDDDLLQGTWWALSLAYDGQTSYDADKAPPGSKMKVTLTGGKIAFVWGETTTSVWPFKLKAGQTPKQIEMFLPQFPSLWLDLTLLQKSMSAQVALPGIYLLEKDSLKICFDPTMRARPTEFATRKGDGLWLWQFKRAKPAGPQEKPKEPKPDKTEAPGSEQNTKTSMDAYLKDVNPQERTLSIEMEGGGEVGKAENVPKTTILNLPVAPNAAISADGKPLRLEDLQLQSQKEPVYLRLHLSATPDAPLVAVAIQRVEKPIGWEIVINVKRK